MKSAAQWAGTALVFALAFAALPGDAQAGTAVAKADALMASSTTAPAALPGVKVIAAQDDVIDCFATARKIFNGCRHEDGGSLATCTRRAAQFFSRCVQGGKR